MKGSQNQTFMAPGTNALGNLVWEILMQKMGGIKSFKQWLNMLVVSQKDYFSKKVRVGLVTVEQETGRQKTVSGISKNNHQYRPILINVFHLYY